MLLLLLHGHGGRSLRLVIWRWQSSVPSVHAHVRTPSSAVHHHTVLVLLWPWTTTHPMHRLSFELLLLVLGIPHVMHVRHSVAVKVPGAAWKAPATGTHSPSSSRTTRSHAAHHSHATWTTRAHSRVRRSSHATGHRMLSLPARTRSHGSRRHLVLLWRLLLRVRVWRGTSWATTHRSTRSPEHHPSSSATAVTARRSAIVAIVFR